MIAVVGEEFVTLKNLMIGEGFAQFAPRRLTPRRQLLSQLSGIFNCSYQWSQMQEHVFVRYPEIDAELPIINKRLVTNKLEAQQKMESGGLLPHILQYTGSPQEGGEWVLKPYASQGGAGIRIYEGGRLQSGFYLQKKANKLREFRAHVGLWRMNPVFTIQEKKPKEELWESVFGAGEFSDSGYVWPANSPQRARLPLTWNINSGFYLRRSTTPWDREEKLDRFPLFRRIEEVAVKAVKALGYQYGAVDILMDDNRWLWVVEVNSHPAIKNPTSKEIYIEALEPLKTMSKMDLFTITEQATSNTVRRCMTRRA